MSERRTIEDVIEPWGFRPERRARMAREAVVALTTATADGPVFSEDGTLAVIRTDTHPSDADYLAWLAVELHNDGYPPWEWQRVGRIAERCRAAALLAAPAPPKANGDEG